MLKTMVYRAKITRIQNWVEDHYNFNKYNTLKDAQDVYIEVSDPDEADLLESINKSQEQLLILKLKWYENYENDKVK